VSQQERKSGFSFCFFISIENDTFKSVQAYVLKKGLLLTLHHIIYDFTVSRFGDAVYCNSISGSNP